MDVSDALRKLAEDPAVAQAIERAQQACAKLRFHEGLRRRWPQARVEAALRCARDSSAIEGARVSLDALRESVAGQGVLWADLTQTESDMNADGFVNTSSTLDTDIDVYRDNGNLTNLTNDASATETVLARGNDLAYENKFSALNDPAWRVGLGAWAAQAQILDIFPPLEAPGKTKTAKVLWPELIAALHRDVCAAEVCVGTIQVEDVALPKNNALAGALAVAQAAAPALVKAAVLQAEIATTLPFGKADGLVARAASRYLLVAEFVDPTGVAQVDWLAAHDPNNYQAALSGYAEGGREGVLAWIRYQAEAVQVGAEQGESVALAILAADSRAG